MVKVVVDMEWVSPAEAAERLDVSERQVRRLASAGDLAARRLGAHWLVSAEAVRERLRAVPHAGRPLDPKTAWALLAAVDAALAIDDDVLDVGRVIADIDDRRQRRRIERLLASPPPIDRWAQWLSRRALQHRVWVHPGVVDRFCADDRAHPGGARAVAVAGLGFSAGPFDRIYVKEPDFPQLLQDYGARPDHDGQLGVMVIPETVGHVAVDRLPQHAMPAAVGFADLLVSANARENHAAREHLGRVMERLTSAVNT